MTGINLGSYPVSSQVHQGLAADAGAGTSRPNRHVAVGFWTFELGPTCRGVHRWFRAHTSTVKSLPAGYLGASDMYLYSSMARAPASSLNRRSDATRILGYPAGRVSAHRGA